MNSQTSMLAMSRQLSLAVSLLASSLLGCSADADPGADASTRPDGEVLGRDAGLARQDGSMAMADAGLARVDAGGGGPSDGGGGPADGGTGSCSALRVVDFTGLPERGSLAGQVSYWGASGSSFGSFASTSRPMPGQTSAAELRVQRGTTGRPGDGSPDGNGDFGFGIDIPEHPGEGDDIWWGLWLQFPRGFDFTTDSASLKFLRFSFGSAGKFEYHLLARGSGAFDGYNILSEWEPRFQSETMHASETGFAEDTWQWFEVHMRLSSNRSLARATVWLDDQLVARREGATTRWYRDGVETDSVTLSGGGATTLPAGAGAQLLSVMVFTYWNGGSPADQSAFVQRVAYTTTEPSARDGLGHPMIGSACARP